MGDSGSLTIGAIISVLALNAVNIDVKTMPDWVNGNMPILIMAILVYPLIDTLRVFAIRIFKGQSPFTADKNHIHHRFIALGYSHRKTAITLYIYTLIVVLFAVAVQYFLDIDSTFWFIITLAFAWGLISIPFLIKPKTHA
jgi:UDP-N-acetylmuramyl pentapeptide phosphotransferase/UDP-N-acetylglucosamine-1-phosphate transferase